MMPQKAKQLFVLLLVTLSGFALSACSTVDGAGKDIESVGEAIQGDDE